MDEDFGLDRIDEVIHGRMRLGVMAYLASTGTADFSSLRTRLHATDGNLSTHLRKLEEAGYVRQVKAVLGRRPVTHISITDAGRAAFVAYLDAMRQLLDAMP
ncbi:winged helix-turn-helix domain-containing protein [Acidomonas methanolica]|uniref:Transcriptional regulator ArsR n=1 Tax=Acidomonas methanolica NBRC 104435 TaxID=1231351 RepID=A0A023D925_ACIMT|nr:transcriptional regulator [Acidomonas methanolica]MBU2653778.1 transcriptional regulator [Acidomonas methanolica]TCS31731.1 winged helix DNA-binding protein [Acidomonas methanolica]GAJ30195.1 transcriptional regulator ArsR [Acidomonas methanolica NBRC 104435]GBQ50711.1 transcriptional regulator [Acidomonas methanolica]GEK98147.1 transcriptional regulator [Acidomonas methanolica NBRC 104435]